MTITLASTKNIKKGTRRTLDNKEYIEVGAFGNGNCLLNSFSLGLIDSILRNELELDEATFNEFANYILTHLDTVAQYKAKYENEGNYPEIIPHLQNFINFIAPNYPTELTLNTEFNFAKFKAYVAQQNTAESIAALHIALAAALRNLAVDKYEVYLEKNIFPQIDQTTELYKQTKEFLEAIKSPDLDTAQEEALLRTHETALNLLAQELAQPAALRQDGVSAGLELLKPLAEFFKINVKAYNSEGVKQGDYYQENNRVVIALLHLPNHWNALVNSERGLVEYLPAVTPSAGKVEKPAKNLKRAQTDSIAATASKINNETKIAVENSVDVELAQKTPAKSSSVESYFQLAEVAKIIEEKNEAEITNMDRAGKLSFFKQAHKEIFKGNPLKPVTTDAFNVNNNVKLYVKALLEDPKYQNAADKELTEDELTAYALQDYYLLEAALPKLKR